MTTKTVIGDRLEIMPVIEFESSGIGSPLGYAAKLHCNVHEFVATLERDWGVLADPADVRHIYQRNVPSSEGMFVVECQPGRGAYPVTIIDADLVRRIVKP